MLPKTTPANELRADPATLANQKYGQAVVRLCILHPSRSQGSWCTGRLNFMHLQQHKPGEEPEAAPEAKDSGTIGAGEVNANKFSNQVGHCSQNWAYFMQRLRLIACIDCCRHS